MLNDFFLALGTLSRIKAPEIQKINYQRSTIYFPAVGYLASGILFFCSYLLTLIFPETLSRIIALAIYYQLFGYFHFDGLLDCIDGFFPSHKSKEDRLRIMKDSNTGAFALLFGVIFLIIEIFCLIQANENWFLFPVLGRITPVFILMFSKPSSDIGLGKLYFPYPKIFALISLCFIIPLFFFSIPSALWVFASILAAFIISRYSKKKIDGITGDVLGFSIMISELLYLMYLNTTLFIK